MGQPDAASVAIRYAPNRPAGRTRSPKLAIALSGGGYRAMLFHCGSLMRLNELGLLSAANRFSSVSGGSITAAVLGLSWDALDVDSRGVVRNFEVVARQLFGFAGRTMDWPSVVEGVLRPRRSAPAALARRYDRYLFGSATLQDLPDEPPRFVFNTTNMATGVLFRWAKAYGADYQVGRVLRPHLRLADVVAASSAFPPFLSPLRVDLPDGSVDTFDGELVPGRHRLHLTDGGIYDNHGLQAVESFETVLASDGGGPFDYNARLRANWFSQSLRTTELIEKQVRSLRRRQLIDELERGERLGALWSINTALSDFPAVDDSPCSEEVGRQLAEVPTRLTKLPVLLRKRLVNFGYLQADAAVRSYVEPGWPAPDGLPFTDAPLR